MKETSANVNQENEVRKYLLLTCHMSGMGYVEIAKYFEVTNTTIWYRRQRIQREYNVLIT